jgi:hypothetical protein
MSKHHEKCCLNLMRDMAEPEFLQMLAQVQTELMRRFPDLKEHVDNLGVRVENIGRLGEVVIDMVTAQCSGATKQ